MNRIVRCLIAFVVGASLASASAEEYPNRRLLIEPTSLANQLDGFVIVDARSAEAYATGHIPGAVRADPDEWRAAFGAGNDAAGWSARIGALGIDGKKPVVVYDDAAGREAARVWWILRYWGVGDVRLLNGFWRGWKAERRTVQILHRLTRPVQFTAKPNGSLAADKHKVKAASDAGGRDVQVVDARSFAEHFGEAPMNNKRPGHIPNSCHLDWSDLVDVKGTQRFRTPGELRRRFEAANINLYRPVIAHCQSGGRAAVMVFAISLMGGKNVANYHPSFAEWSADSQMPVEKTK